MRALFWGALAEGESRCQGILDSPDIEAMCAALRQIGAKISLEGGEAVIQGVAGAPLSCEDVIDAKNSGIVLRFLGAIGGLIPSYMVITGDPSIRSRRPIQPLIDGLRQFGAFAASMRENGHAPLLVRGPMRAGRVSIEGRDSQPVSALLMAATFLPGESEIRVTYPGETPWIDLTLGWMHKLGLEVHHKEYTLYHIAGGGSYQGFSYRVPGDYSSAAFPLAAAVLTQSSITLDNLPDDDLQGDRKFLDQLEEMGARFIHAPAEGALTTLAGHLHGRTIDVNEMIDALPILAVVGCAAEGETRLINGAIARKKESDRISAICHELQKMGADIEEEPEGLRVRPSSLRGARVDSHSDHRIAMALTIAALFAEGETEITHVDCVAKSYPGFARELHHLGVDIEEVETPLSVHS